jgi:hypothetical protein
MFVSKKEHDVLKKELEEQKAFIGNMMEHMMNMQKEINELKKPKEPNYFG